MDIIFLAAIAVYIFIKLRAELGKIDENQKRDAIKNFINQKAQNQATIDSKPTLINAPSENADNSSEVITIDKKSLAVIEAIESDVIRYTAASVLQRAKILPGPFMDGAVKAFEMVIEAFAAGDISKVQPLLSPQIYQQFESAINQRKAENQILNTKILAIDESKITGARMINDIALITIKFTSRQINYLTDNNSVIIDGSKEDFNKIIDVWTFKKDCQSSNPNWFISATSDQ